MNLLGDGKMVIDQRGRQVGRTRDMLTLIADTMKEGKLYVLFTSDDNLAQGKLIQEKHPEQIVEVHTARHISRKTVYLVEKPPTVPFHNRYR